MPRRWGALVFILLFRINIHIRTILRSRGVRFPSAACAVQVRWQWNAGFLSVRAQESCQQGRKDSVIAAQVGSTGLFVGFSE